VPRDGGRSLYVFVCTRLDEPNGLPGNHEPWQRARGCHADFIWRRIMSRVRWLHDCMRRCHSGKHAGALFSFFVAQLTSCGHSHEAPGRDKRRQGPAQARPPPAHCRRRRRRRRRGDALSFDRAGHLAAHALASFDRSSVSLATA
jgi:hypothetical protein